MTVLPPTHIAPRIIRSNLAYGILGIVTSTLALSSFIYSTIFAGDVGRLQTHPDVPRIWPRDARACALEGSTQIDFLAGPEVFMTIVSVIAIVAGLVVSLASWVYRYWPMERPDLKHPISLYVSVHIIYPISATAVLATYCSIWANHLEWDQAGLSGCQFSTTGYDETSIQVMKCTDESLACHILPNHGVPIKYTVVLCQQKRFERFCMTIIMFCSFAILSIWAWWAGKRLRQARSGPGSETDSAITRFMEKERVQKD